MFGLMRHAPRLPYCGTCKTLGALYGQRARAALSHDMVFLAELLLEMTGQPQWLPSYQSFNCLNLPRRGDSLPVGLEYAATINVALAHFQIQDHVADSGKLHWRVAARWFSPAYRNAAARLREWRFPIDKMAAILQTQAEREANPQTLEHVAEPTVTSTALAFGEGARICGHGDLAQPMSELGAKFGRLIYVLDAYEDRERDAMSGAFNATRTFPEFDPRQDILDTAAAIASDLSPPLANRLHANVGERLGLRLPVLCSCRRATVRGRLRAAMALAREVTFGSVLAFAAQPPPAPGVPPPGPAQPLFTGDSGPPPVNPGSCCNCRGACCDCCGDACCEDCCGSCGG